MFYMPVKYHCYHMDNLPHTNLLLWRTGRGYISIKGFELLHYQLFSH